MDLASRIGVHLSRAAGERGVDIGEDLVHTHIAGRVGRFLHRIGILASAQGLHLAAQFIQFGLAGHFIEAGAEFRGHAPHPAHELAQLA